MVGSTIVYHRPRHVRRAIVSFVQPKSALVGYGERKCSDLRLEVRGVLRVCTVVLMHLRLALGNKEKTQNGSGTFQY